MTVDAEDIEAMVRETYTEAGQDILNPPGSVEIAKHHPRLAIEFVPNLLRQSALRANDNGRHTIELPLGISDEATNWKCSHEIGEFKTGPGRKRPIVVPHRERLVDNFAAELSVPRVALRAAVREVGFDLPLLARLFCVTQTILTLRLGEALGIPVALLGMQWQRHALRFGAVRRGPNVLPSDTKLVNIVAEKGAPGCRVIWLTDTKRAVAVIGEPVE
jgi:hypothetical protein